MPAPKIDAQGLKTDGIPADILPAVRAWWAREIERIAKAHGNEWPKHREWIEDYLNAEVRERLAKRK